MLFVNSTKVQHIIDNSPAGKNTKFLSAAHSLWTRFHNYEKQLPMAYEVNGEIVSLIFATLNRDGYVNLYEIVTVEGKEGNGYASKCWDSFMDYCVNVKKMQRLKISCTPSSVTWHMRNGLIFWAVDPSGSLRSDQKIFATRQEQISYQNSAVSDPLRHLPPPKAREQFLKEGLEDHKFGSKKKLKTENAIKAVGDFWLRDALFKANTNLEEFLK